VRSVTAALLLVFACRPLGFAERPRIVGFVHDGTIRWTNAQTGLYYGIQFTMDASWSWIPWPKGPWNVRATSLVSEARVDLHHYSRMDLSHIQELERRKEQGFYRIVVSGSRLEIPLMTHRVRVVNESAGPVSNISFWATDGGGRHDYTNISLLAPDGATPYVDITARVLTNEVVVMPPSSGWRVSFERKGVRKYVGTYMFGFGPPRSKISTAIRDDDSARVCFEWLQWSMICYAREFSPWQEWRVGGSIDRSAPCHDFPLAKSEKDGYCDP